VHAALHLSIKAAWIANIESVAWLRSAAVVTGVREAPERWHKCSNAVQVLNLLALLAHADAEARGAGALAGECPSGCVHVFV
jgi:hypothetical protein